MNVRQRRIPDPVFTFAAGSCFSMLTGEVSARIARARSSSSAVPCTTMTNLSATSASYLTALSFGIPKLTSPAVTAERPPTTAADSKAPPGQLRKDQQPKLGRYLASERNQPQRAALKCHPKISMRSPAGYCPKERRQADGLLELHRELEVGYCRLVTISTDNIIETNGYRNGVGAHRPFLTDAARTIQKDFDIAELRILSTIR
jgi:hypothetical protein